MDDKTLEALKGSIKKWEGIVAGTIENQGALNCPLCQLFNTSDECDGCPVKERTGEDFCEGSPYYSYEQKVQGSAQAELDFLKSLLPPTE